MEFFYPHVLRSFITTKRLLHLRDIISLALIGIIFGVTYFVASFAYNELTILLTPIGYSPMANGLTVRIWCIAGPLADFLLRTPGAAFFGELLGTAIEIPLDDQWRTTNLVSGAAQGVGSELGSIFTFYKMYSWLTFLISSPTLAFVAFGWDWFRNGYNHFSGQIPIIMLIVHFVSVFVFSGILVKLVTNPLQ